MAEAWVGYAFFTASGIMATRTMRRRRAPVENHHRPQHVSAPPKNMRASKITTAGTHTTT